MQPCGGDTTSLAISMGAAAMVVFLLAYAISQTMFNGGSTPLVLKAWGACSSQGETHDKVGRVQPERPSSGTKCVELHEHTTSAAASSVPETTLTWSYTPATNTVSIAYTDTALSATGWVGWGINLHGTTMLNADVLIGFQQPPPAIATPQLLRYKLTSALYGGASSSSSSSSSSSLTPVASFDDGLSVLQNMTLLIQTTTNSSAGAVRFTILATLHLPPGVSSINTIYNRGPSVSPPNIPLPHAAGQRNGMKTIHLLTGTVSSPGGGGGGGSNARFLLKCVHGVLALLSWGLLLLFGAMAARYMKRVAGADPAWFHAHVWLQVLGYSVGTIAWALGLRLGALSPGIVYHSHRNLGIAIFVMATLQITAFFARPQKLLPDHHQRHRNRRRLIWEIFHHTNGYAVLLLSIINVFKGFRILAAPARYSGIYIAFLVALACACLGLEARSSADLVRARWGHKSRDRRDMPPPPPPPPPAAAADACLVVARGS